MRKVPGYCYNRLPICFSPSAPPTIQQIWWSVQVSSGVVLRIGSINILELVNIREDNGTKLGHTLSITEAALSELKRLEQSKPTPY